MPGFQRIFSPAPPSTLDEETQDLLDDERKGVMASTERESHLPKLRERKQKPVEKTLAQRKDLHTYQSSPPIVGCPRPKNRFGESCTDAS